MERVTGKAGRALEKLRTFLEKSERDARIRAGIFILLLVIFGTAQFLLNSHTPMLMDDYDYSFSWATGERITSVSQIPASQAAHYLLWGGRSIVHALAQLFLGMDRGIFRAANTAVWILLLLEIYALAKPKERSFCWTLLATEELFLFFGVPFFGTVFLWLTGSCNYLWGTVLALLPLLVFRNIEEGGVCAKPLSGSLLFPLGILCGWTNENIACGIAGTLVLCLTVKIIRERKLPVSLIWMSAGECIGAAVMILAPGNSARAGAGGTDIGQLLFRFISVTAYGLMYGGFLLILLILLYSVLRVLGVCIPRRRVLIPLGAALLAAYAMVLSPQLSDRTYTGVLALMLVSVLSLEGVLEENERRLDACKLLILPLCLFLFACGTYSALSKVKSFEALWLSETAKIEAAAQAGEESVTVRSVPSVSAYTMTQSIGDDDTQWPNSTLSKYYGIRVEGKNE